MRQRLILSLALLSLVSWPPGARAAEASNKGEKPASSASQEVVDFDPEADPPPGAPADVALWRSGRQVTFDVLSSRREASRLQIHVRSQRMVERLGDAAKALPKEEASKLGALQAQIKAAWSDNYEVMSRRWPVDPTRGCGYQWLNFESVLRAAAAGSTRADLVTARDALQACVNGAGAAVAAMRRSNAAFAATVAEAERALAKVEPQKSAAAAPKDAAAPKGGERGHHQEKAEEKTRQD